MRSLFACLSLSLLAPAAFAEGPEAPVERAPIRSVSAAAAPAPALAAVVLDETPPRCKSLAKRAQVPSAMQSLAARISLAGCIADARMEPLSLIDGQESVLAIDVAVHPGLTMLDGVIDSGDAAMKVMALRAKAELYGRMRVKMMATVPAPANTTPEAAALRETRREIVESMVQPWSDRTRDAHQAIVALGKKHPELAKNPVAQATIRTSEQQLAQQVAGT